MIINYRLVIIIQNNTSVQQVVQGGTQVFTRCRSLDEMSLYMSHIYLAGHVQVNLKPCASLLPSISK